MALPALKILDLLPSGLSVSSVVHSGFPFEVERTAGFLPSRFPAKLKVQTGRTFPPRSAGREGNASSWPRPCPLRNRREKSPHLPEGGQS